MKRRGVNIRAASNSYGTSSPLGQAIYDALDALGNEGILNVFAAGNNSQNNDATPFNPANYPATSIISVAATDQSDNLASFSSFGPTNVDLAAPGVDILLTSGSTTNAYYGPPGRSGTSYACPYVAGAVALLASAYPAATAAELKAAILNGVDLVPALTNKMVTHGRLNVAKAIELIVPPALLITNLSVSPDGQSLSFAWKVRAAKTYRVQYKNNLNELDWIDLSTVPTINGSIASIMDTVGTSSQRFYRVVELE